MLTDRTVLLEGQGEQMLLVLTVLMILLERSGMSVGFLVLPRQAHPWQTHHIGLRRKPISVRLRSLGS